MSEPVVLLKPDELQDRIQEGVESALTRVLSKEIRKATTKAYMTKNELMQLTGWSSRQIEYRKQNRSIPFLRRGRTILFPTDEIYAFLEEGRRGKLGFAEANGPGAEPRAGIRHRARDSRHRAHGVGRRHRGGASGQGGEPWRLAAPWR